jgi:hypothetical protein
MKLFQTDFRLIDVAQESLHAKVFSDVSVMKSFDWLAEYKDSLSFMFSQKRLLELQKELSQDSIDWSIILGGFNTAKTFRPIWIESGLIGWLAWPVGSVVNSTGTMMDVDHIYISKFYLTESQPGGIPVSGFIDMRDLKPKTSGPVRRHEMSAAIRFVVPKVMAKTLTREAIDSGGSEDEIKDFMKKAASEHAGSFMIGFYLAFSYFRAAEQNAAYFS